MRTLKTSFTQMVNKLPDEVKIEADLSFSISDEISALMQERGLSKKQFAEALGKKPSEVTKWLSGQHNFTIRTLSMLSAFFGKPLILVPDHASCEHVGRPVEYVGENDMVTGVAEMNNDSLRAKRHSQMEMPSER